ncbi:hypothetical protein [Dokdonella sp.]|uniref:hypothetical protein n=1 Tax=Dokdonella sp. TaxID=2291710 RepID=UPI0035297768
MAGLLMPVRIGPFRFGQFTIAVCMGFLTTSDAAAGSCGGAIGASSDNIYRGFDLGDGQWGGLGDVHCAFATNWIAGLGATRVHLPGLPEDVQLAVYLDRRWRLSDDWNAKLGLIHYDTLRAVNRPGLQYDEVNAAISFRGRWQASLAWSPAVGNAYAPGFSGDNAWMWLETAWRQPLGDRFSIDMGLGFARPSGRTPADYRYASVGINFYWSGVVFNASHIWTDRLTYTYDRPGQSFVFELPAQHRWTGSLVWMF